jgi:hypothetical protein
MRGQSTILFLALVACSCTREEDSNIQMPDFQDPVATITLPAVGDTLLGLVDIEVEATDNVGIARVEFYIDGGLPDSLAIDLLAPYAYAWHTDDFPDGPHLIFVRAYDLSENYGDAVPFLVQVDNVNENAPRNLLVPNQYPTIQQAVNAARDGDTVLVAPGTYHEDFNYKGKGIWVKSLLGPAVTVWEGVNQNVFIYFNSGEDTNSVLCGFKIVGSYNGIVIDLNCSPAIMNCIFLNIEYTGIIGGPANANIMNNTFFNCQDGIQIGGISLVLNNVVVHSSHYGLWNAQLSPQYAPFGDYNNVWDSGIANYNDRWVIGEHDISVDPLFQDTLGFRLLPGSPCINAGDPALLDPDGTRSDIGAWGGPHAYDWL